MSRIALVTADRELAVIDPGDSKRRLITGAPSGVLWGNWAQMGERSTHSWPTFSPDGRQIACFRTTGRVQASVWVSDLDGVVSTDLIDLAGRVPIYLQWSTDGQRLAAVTQDGGELLLTAARTGDPTSARLLAKGSPLFFTWDDRDQVAAFVGGGSQDARMLLLDPDAQRAPQVLPGVPGDFCAPVLTTQGVVYASHRAGSAEILAHRPDETRTYPGGEGLLAFVPSPDRRYLARACASNGDGSPYTRLVVLDLEKGTTQEIADVDMLSFMWTPDGKALVIARIDQDRGLVEWSRIDLNGVRRSLVDMIPTPDMRFYLRFFEQYTQSHPLIDADSAHLLIAGVVRGRGTKSRVWKVPLAGGAIEDLGEGQFAVFGPAMDN